MALAGVGVMATAAADALVFMPVPHLPSPHLPSLALLLVGVAIFWAVVILGAGAVILLLAPHLPSPHLPSLTLLVVVAGVVLSAAYTGAWVATDTANTAAIEVRELSLDMSFLTKQVADHYTIL